MEFKEFGKIENIGKLYMTITQKMHGSNAQLAISVAEIKAGSRSRWLFPGKETDNYGFAQWVHNHEQILIQTLGEGRHYGEWCGPGINSGEGFTERTLLLFNWRRWSDKLLPENVRIVPPLYSGKVSFDAIEEVMHDLKINGSRAVKGYMKPEGIVIEIGDKFYKKVFDPEDTGWINKEKKERTKLTSIDINHLLQPIRLEKLLSRDEQYLVNYPSSLAQICKDYVADLKSELIITEEEQKALGKKVFLFVKAIIENIKDLSTKEGVIK